MKLLMLTTARSAALDQSFATICLQLQDSHCFSSDIFHGSLILQLVFAISS